MKNKEEKKNRIWVPIVIGALACSAAVGTGIALTHNQQRPKAGTVATMSDAADFSGLTTEVAEVTTEEATTEAVIEAAVSGNEKPEAVPATTEIGGGKKKAEETTEEKKPSTTESAKPSTNHNNSGSASSGQSTTPKPSNNGSSSGNSGSSSLGNSGNSSSGNGGNSNSTPSQKPSTPATTEAPKPSTTEAPTTQHQHVYDQVVVDTPEQRIDYPEQGYYAPAKRCNTCYQVFTSSDDFVAHATYGGGSCPADGYGTTQVWIKTGDPYTEEIPAKTHRECKCGARE